MNICFYCGQLDPSDRHQNLHRYEAHCPEMGESPDDARNICAASLDDAAETYAELSDDDGDYTIVQSNEEFKVAVRKDNPSGNQPWRMFSVTGEQISTYTAEELEEAE